MLNKKNVSLSDNYKFKRPTQLLTTKWITDFARPNLSSSVSHLTMPVNSLHYLIGRRFIMILQKHLASINDKTGLHDVTHVTSIIHLN